MMERFAAAFPAWLSSLALVAIAATAALAVHWLALKLARRASSRTTTDTDDIVLRRLHAPLRWLLVAFALSAIQPGLALDKTGLVAWSRIAGLVFPALVGWIAIALLGVGADIVKSRADITAADNLQARRRRTRADILHRIGMFVILGA